MQEGSKTQWQVGSLGEHGESLKDCKERGGGRGVESKETGAWRIHPTGLEAPR